jgi:hypothetical protein
LQVFEHGKVMVAWGANLDDSGEPGE